MIETHQLSTLPCNGSILNGEFINNPVRSIFILLRFGEVKIFKAEEINYYVECEVVLCNPFATIYVNRIEQTPINKIEQSFENAQDDEFKVRFCNNGFYADINFIEEHEKYGKVNNLDKMLKALESILLTAVMNHTT